VRRDFVAAVDVRVDADTAAAGGVPQIDLARAGGEIVVGILRVDAAFDGVTARLAVDDVIGERLARGDRGSVP
jgi:hypothetical protein